MGTKWNYKRERIATAEEVAEAIHASVTIQDALNVYCPGIEVKHGRCPCPIHNGKDNNFSFTDQWFKCFVCGASGDVISLVKETCELSTRGEAMQKICDDFRLPVNFHAPISKEASDKVNRIREEAKQKLKAKEDWEERYHEAIDRWIALDIIVNRTPLDSKENIMRVCKAKEELARASYQLDLVLASEPR